MSPKIPANSNGFMIAVAVAWLVAFGLFGAVRASSASPAPGATIYAKQCASCHGKEGQGVADGYDMPLAGAKDLHELTMIIERSMPEEDPTQCVGQEARQVAQYVYEQFYSAEVRREKGMALVPRIELVRLTVPQYRNAVADLIGSFTPPPRESRRGRPDRGSAAHDDNADPSIQPGLAGEYYQSKGMNKADKFRLSRIDHQIDFDFGDGSPSDQIDPEQFAIVWQGSIHAPTTGYYEFRLRTPNGARLYVNNDPPQSRRKLRDDSSVAGQSALIDQWVSSGELREGEARLFLLGGRRYPIRLEFFKYKEPTASIQLQWKPPKSAWSLIDSRHLDSSRSPRTFVVATPFPADDRSQGFERGSSVSHAWQAATNNAAIAASTEIINRLPLLAGYEKDAPENRRRERTKQFLLQLASRAFRRPLTSPETRLLGEELLSGDVDLEVAVRRAVLLILDSPHFLYPDLTPAGQTPDSHVIASRLSFILWDSIPDQPLFAAADAGHLQQPAALTEQAERMLTDPRAKAKMRRFFHHWLELDERDLTKDNEQFPEFDEHVVADLRYSLNRFLEEVVWSEQSDYRQLLLADYLLLNDRLKNLYDAQDKMQSIDEPSSALTAVEQSGDEAEEDEAEKIESPPNEFRRFRFPKDRRAGVLTHPFLLSAFSYHNNTSPIHRGVFLTRNIVGRGLNPPPIAVAFKDSDFPEDLTMREKVTLLTRDKACMSCHSVINPLGFTLENFDAVGRWRTSENNKPIDSQSEYTTARGESLLLSSARDVADFAVSSDSAQRAFVVQLFQHLVKQNPDAYGPETVQDLVSQFVEDDYNIQRLMIRVAVLAARHKNDLQTADLRKPKESGPKS